MTEGVVQRRRDLLALYDHALPEVYGYLYDRCDDRATAEDLTSETFLAAVRALESDVPPPVSIPWMIGVARHKLVDHWRRRSRDERVEPSDPPAAEDPWDAHVDEMRAVDVLRVLGDHHRLVLTLRYVDDLPVRDVAAILGRTEGATEALLVRARVAFRREYERGEVDAG